ncbi:hypothetical protein ACFL6C_13050, partial [Myxococcota bacterium]
MRYSAVQTHITTMTLLIVAAGCGDSWVGLELPGTLTSAQSIVFDVLILNSEVYPDGETGPLLVDLGIDGDRIAAIGDLSGCSAQLEINGSGLTTVPGFIDAHSHADAPGAWERL